jgi:aryl-alcohol dehydrogenase
VRIRAAVTESRGAPFAIEELELDEPRADEVVVRIAACDPPGRIHRAVG